MKELLTNEEIDTLLEAFRSEGPPPEEVAFNQAFVAREPDAGPLVSEVDLLKPNRFSRDQVRSFERIFETSAKGISATMSDKLRLEVLCDCVATEQMRFQSWLGLVGSPCGFYVLKMPPFEGLIPFTVTTALLYGAVDRILGGAGKPDERTDFTEAEYTVADAFVKPCLDRLCESLEDIAPLSCEIENRFCNPSMAQILPSQDVVLSIHFQVSSDLLLGDLRLAIPYNALASRLEGVQYGPSSPFQTKPGAMRDTTTVAVRPVPLTLSVELGAAEVPLRQLLDLQIGDVLPLSTRVGDPLPAPVQGKPKFTGHVGRRGSQLAFQVASLAES